MVVNGPGSEGGGGCSARSFDRVLRFPSGWTLPRPSQPEGMASPPPGVLSDSRNRRATRRALAFSRWVALLHHCGRLPPFPAGVSMTGFGPSQGVLLDTGALTWNEPAGSPQPWARSLEGPQTAKVRKVTVITGRMPAFCVIWGSAMTFSSGSGPASIELWAD